MRGREKEGLDAVLLHGCGVDGGVSRRAAMADRTVNWECERVSAADGGGVGEGGAGRGERASVSVAEATRSTGAGRTTTATAMSACQCYAYDVNPTEGYNPTFDQRRLSLHESGGVFCGERVWVV